MGWFGGRTEGAESSEDPYKKLDPGLREFLNKQSPTKHDEPTSNPPPTPSNTLPSTDAAPNTYRSQAGFEGQAVGHHATDTDAGAAVPKQSLYQDGRYAHLWKGYRPQAEVEGAGKSDQDRLGDIVSAYKDRKADIGRAALENCVDYQLAERDCLTNGSLWKKMSMCREESKAFNRCYTMQARFLSALGYLSAQRSEAEEEQVQMHADKLYHEMLERERTLKAAEEAGQELPQMPPLIEPEKTTQALGENSAWARARQKAVEGGAPTSLSSYTPEKQEEIKKRIEGLSAQEKELELQLIAAETRSQLEYAAQISETMELDKQRREERRERGKETIGDTLRRVWGS